MATPAINSAASAIGGQASAAGGGFAALSSTDFIKVLLTELSNQDPFQPQDSGALLEQLSSLRNIESQLSLQKGLESLVLQNGVTSAAGLIGKDVEGLDANNDSISGVVASVRVERGKAVLELSSGKSLAIDRVTSISQPTGA
ncbi:MAG: flagellar hook capping FlgD N-terminal domain-containing protein [Phycisphaeraceae bacterium]